MLHNILTVRNISCLVKKCFNTKNISTLGFSQTDIATYHCIHRSLRHNSHWCQEFSRRVFFYIVFPLLTLILIRKPSNYWLVLLSSSIKIASASYSITQNSEYINWSLVYKYNVHVTTKSMQFKKHHMDRLSGPFVPRFELHGFKYCQQTIWAQMLLYVTQYYSVALLISLSNATFSKLTNQYMFNIQYI